MMRKRITSEWRGKIAGNQNWALRAALRICQQQTDEEQNTRATLESNGVGFTAFDAEFVTSVVQQHLEGKRLTKKQSDALRRIMPKYAGQLYRIVYGNADSSKPSQEKT